MKKIIVLSIFATLCLSLHTADRSELIRQMQEDISKNIAKMKNKRQKFVDEMKDANDIRYEVNAPKKQTASLMGLWASTYLPKRPPMRAVGMVGFGFFTGAYGLLNAGPFIERVLLAKIDKNIAKAEANLHDINKIAELVKKTPSK